VTARGKSNNYHSRIQATLLFNASWMSAYMTPPGFWRGGGWKLSDGDWWVGSGRVSFVLVNTHPYCLHLKQTLHCTFHHNTPPKSSDCTWIGICFHAVNWLRYSLRSIFSIPYTRIHDATQIADTAAAAASQLQDAVFSSHQRREGARHPRTLTQPEPQPKEYQIALATPQ